jgi:cytochrome c553
MQPIAAALDESEMRELARYYAGLPGGGARDRASGDPRRGRAIAHDGIPAQRVPACAECHGPRPTRRNLGYPLLAGQYAEYLRLQLELLSERRRGGSRYVHLMHEVAPHLTAEQRADVASYYGSLPPASAPGAAAEGR